MPSADRVLLTDVEGKPGRFWASNTTFVGPMRPPPWLCRLVGEAWAWNLTGIVAALRLFLRRGHCQAVVTEGGASGLLFAWLQALVPWGRKPHVMIDCLWNLPRGPLRRWFQRLRFRLAARSVYRFVVWASHEVEDYAAAFGLPREKLTYVPFHSTLEGYACPERDDGYLFSGGNCDRDYRTLVEAVRPLGVPTWIASTRGPELLAGLELPPHVRVEATTPDGFRRAMAAARLVVVPMEAGLLHSGGQQTCLNGMLLGKPTIAVGRKWARDFIEDGEDGLVVDYGDVAGLRRAVAWLLEDPARAADLAERGRAKAAWFTTERTMRHVYELACGEAADGAGQGTSKPLLARRAGQEATR